MADYFVVLSVGSAHLMTNLDNLVLLLAMLASGGRGTAVGAFAGVQIAVVVLAAILGEALASVAGGYLGLMGLVPIALGLVQIARSAPDGADTAPRPAFAAQLAVFAGCSADSLAVLTALYADSTDRIDVSISAGAAASILTVTMLAMFLGAPLAGLARRLAPLAPYVMIAAGIYVLMDTPTDLV